MGYRRLVGRWHRVCVNIHRCIRNQARRDLPRGKDHGFDAVVENRRGLDESVA